MVAPLARNGPIVCSDPLAASKRGWIFNEPERKAETARHHFSLSVSGLYARRRRAKKSRKSSLFLSGIHLSTQINNGRHSCRHDHNCRGYRQGVFHSSFFSPFLENVWIIKSNSQKYFFSCVSRQITSRYAVRPFTLNVHSFKLKVVIRWWWWWWENSPCEFLLTIKHDAGNVGVTNAGSILVFGLNGAFFFLFARKLQRMMWLA